VFFAVGVVMGDGMKMGRDVELIIMPGTDIMCEVSSGSCGSGGSGGSGVGGSR